MDARFVRRALKQSFIITCLAKHECESLEYGSPKCIDVCIYVDFLSEVVAQIRVSEPGGNIAEHRDVCRQHKLKFIQLELFMFM